MLQIWLQKVTDFITKKCYKFDYKKLLTSLQKSVTNLITKNYWLHNQKILQICWQKVTDFITKKYYKFDYKKLLTSLPKSVINLIDYKKLQISL